MPKYVFANGQITVEDGLYTPIDRDVADPHRGVVLMVKGRLMPTFVKGQIQQGEITMSKRTRYAIYTRYSSDMQNEISLEAQERLCREEIAKRGGAVVAVYSDGAKSGWSLEREGFIELRRHAEHGKFEAIMFWKFDRLARNHDHTVMIKMLLRHEYHLKLYCVEGFSEDDDDSPYTAMMEQLLAVISAFYSKNLSSETKRGKRQRALNGNFNGSVPPLGYDLVTVADSTPERPPGLYINPRQAVLVRRVFPPVCHRRL